jgi:hypothetical protein
MPNAQPQIPRRVIRPLASSSSVVAPAYNPVNASIQQLAERVQTELPTASAAETVRMQTRPVEVVQAAPVQVVAAAPAPQPRPEPARAEPAREPATERRSAPPVAAAAPASSANPGALGPAGARIEPAARGEESPPRRRRVATLLDRIDTFMHGSETSAIPASAAEPPVAQTQAPRQPVAEAQPAAKPERVAPSLPREEPAERLVQSSLEEEQLDIPTFLRRQMK